MEYEEFLGDKEKTPIWRHFLRAKDRNSAKCKTCNKILKCVGGSTSGLHKHFRNVHNVDTEKNPPSRVTTDLSRPSTSASTSKKAKLTDYFESAENPSTATRISRMIALDGISFKTLANSTDIREVFQKAGHSIPKSQNTIREVVFEHHKEKQEEIKMEIKKLLNKNEKFAISFDEWTSNKDRRYISLNIHSPSLGGPFKFKNLGLIRVIGSLPAKQFIEQIRQRLETFGLSLESDIIAETTDGCSVMVKIGKLLGKYLHQHQLCIAHGIQLALSDVFYKKPTTSSRDDIDEQEDEDLFEDEDDITLAEWVRRCGINSDTFFHEHDIGNDDDTDDGDDSDGVLFAEEIRNYENTRDQSSFTYFDLISKVRTVVKLFKKSPTKNEDILQKYVQTEFSKEYQLVLDAKTRWSSMADMLSRFIKLKVCIGKALLDVKSEIFFCQEEWKTLQELHEILDIIKTIVESLSRRDSTLLTADIAIKYAIKKLTEMNTNLSTQMKNTLTKRYSERRLIAASTLYYLTNPNQYFEDVTNEDMLTFPRLTSDDMCRQIVKLVTRTTEEEPAIEVVLHPSEEDIGIGIDGSEASEPNPVPEISKADELNLELRKATGTIQTRPSDNDLNDFEKIKIEMVLFENGGDRGKTLSLAYKYLSAIPPTSVEPERIFSSAGYICNRLRTRLSDRSLDVISFLRSYYQEKTSH